MYSTVQGWQIGFVTLPSTDQMVASTFCIVLQRILRLSLNAQETKALHQLSLSTLVRNVKTDHTFPTVCHLWFLGEDETNFTETISNQHRQEGTLWLVALWECGGQILWWPPIPLISRCSHLCVIPSPWVWVEPVTRFKPTEYDKSDET